MTEQRAPKFWFPVKRYGFGWGLPNCWQGWVVFACMLAVAVLTALLSPYIASDALVLALIVLWIGLLIGVVWGKGEKPLRWRWGE